MKGKDSVIADALSQPEDKQNFFGIPVYDITPDIPATGSPLEAVRVTTQADPLLSKLKNQIFQG